MSPKAVRALAMGGALLVVVLLAMMFLGSDDSGSGDADSGSASFDGAGPEQALEDGERALHQGKWIDALTAFKRLRRFPTSDEAQEVRERGLQKKALEEIMEAEPSATTVHRLEQLAELYPERPEVRERLGAVRKALSSGARAAPVGGGDAGVAD